MVSSDEPADYESGGHGMRACRSVEAFEARLPNELKQTEDVECLLLAVSLEGSAACRQAIEKLSKHTHTHTHTYVHVCSRVRGHHPPPPPQWYPPPPTPHGPTPRHSPKPVLLRGPAPAAHWGKAESAAVVSRTRHELQLLNYEGCMAMVMVAAVL